MHRKVASRAAACIMAAAIAFSGSEGKAALAADTSSGATDALADIIADNSSKLDATKAAAGASKTLASTVAAAEETTAEEEDTTDIAASQAAAETEDTSSEDIQETESADASQSGDYSSMGVTTVEDSVNVRSDASTDSEIVGYLYSSNVFTVTDAVDGWYQIESGNVSGWVSADYVNVGDESAVKEAGIRIATVNADSLRVRESADEDAEIITLVEEGDGLYVGDVDDSGWVYVGTEEGDGYVSADYVSVDYTYTHGETVEEQEARIAEEEAIAQAEAEAEAAAAAAQAASSSSSSSSSSGSKSSSSGKTYKAASGKSGSAVASYASQFAGNPYVYGGTSLTNGCDCSGFVMSVYAAFGVSLPHSSSSMRSVGSGVDVSNIQVGDIVCYSGHVGIYVGGGSIISALGSKYGITYSSLHYKSIITVRRIFS